MNQFRLTNEQFAATVAKVNKVNERAVKKGLAGRITITGTSVLVTEQDSITGIERTFEMVDVVLGGEAPKLNGWSFIASLDWDAEAGLIVRTAPGVVSVDRSNLVKGACGHCKTNRARKNTYLVRHEDGTEIQVGSTCVKDFLGIEVGVAWLDESSIVDFMGSFSGGPINHGTVYVLSLAWALIKLDGWKPSSSYGSTTKGDTFSILYPPRVITAEYREWAGRVRELAVEAVERADEVRAFVASDDFAGDSEYVRNLKAICAADSVSDRNIGFLVSAPQAMTRNQAKTLVREAKQQGTSKWVGQKDDKVSMKVVVKAIKWVSNGWGTSILYTMMDESGNVVKAFCSREIMGEETDKEFFIQGTIKSHSEFNNVKETVLTRVKVAQ